MKNRKETIEDIIERMDDSILACEVCKKQDDLNGKNNNWDSVIFGLKLAKLNVLNASIELCDELLNAMDNTLQNEHHS